MANVGSGSTGTTLIGQGNGASPTYAAIGTSSGLTAHGVVVAEGNSAFVATSVGTNGQVLLGATGADPAFGTITSPNSTITFTTGANSLAMDVNGSKVGETITGQSGGALSPTAGNWNINGASTAAGTTPVTTSGAVSTLTVNVQKSQAIASTDATKVGLATFDSARFSVDANGFVTLNGSGVSETITGDSGGALSPTAGNWNILGRSGSKTSGSGSTLTIKSPPYADAGGSATSTLNSGSFVTGAFTLTLPASAGLADGDLFEYVATSSSAMVIQAVGAQKIRMGTLLSSAAGSITSTSIGDAVMLRFRATDGFFYATSIIGTWVVA